MRLLRQAAWSGWEERGFRKETRPYLPCCFLAHSPDGPGLRIRLDPCRVTQQRPDGYSRCPQKQRVESISVSNSHYIVIEQSKVESGRKEIASWSMDEPSPWDEIYRKGVGPEIRLVCAIGPGKPGADPGSRAVASIEISEMRSLFFGTLPQAHPVTRNMGSMDREGGDRATQGNGSPKSHATTNSHFIPGRSCRGKSGCLHLL
jgi:hypothetical protein